MIGIVRLVASDLDGTLLRPDGFVLWRTVRAVDAVASCGIDVVVTARPPRWTRAIASSLRCYPLAICSNGGMVYDVGADAVVLEHPIERAGALEIVLQLGAEIAGAAICDRIKGGDGVRAALHGDVEQGRRGSGGTRQSPARTARTQTCAAP